MSDRRIKPERLKERIAAAEFSYSHVARQLGVKQPTISRLVKGEQSSTARIDLLASILGTTPGYLTGETDDPSPNASTEPSARSYQAITMQVLLPAEDVLTRMFEALLAMVDPTAPPEDQARSLAKNLPVGLSQLRDLLPDPKRGGQAGSKSGQPKMLVEQR